MTRDNVKKILVIISINLVLSLIVLNLVSYMQYKKYVYSVNNALSSIIGKDEDVSVKILNNSNNYYDSIDIEKYGIDNNTSIINSMNTKFKSNLIINNIIVLMFNMILAATLIVHNKYNNKKIVNMTKYLSELNNGNYDIDLSNCREGELAKLEDEIYKTMISLKASNDNLYKDKLLLNEYLEDISHQIKTPMTSINILIDTILNDIELDNKKRNEFLLEIQKQNSKIEYLVLNLLKLAKFDVHAISLKKEKIYVYKLINKIIDNLAILIEIKDIKIKVNCKKKYFFIGDFKWQEEALTNILKNSIEHSFDNGTICINCISNSIYTKIDIKDSGSGINSTDLKHLFDRFYKIENSKKDSIGIGLSLSKKIINNGNGHIKVKSNLNKGTIFQIKYFK